MGHREWSRNKPRWCAWLEACPGSGDCGVQRALLHCLRPQTWVTDLSSTQFFRLPSSWGRKRAQRVRIRFWSLTAWVQIPTLPLTIRVPWSELFVPCNSVLSPAQQTESSEEELGQLSGVMPRTVSDTVSTHWVFVVMMTPDLFFQDPQVLQSGAPFLGCSGGCCAVAKGIEGRMELEILAGEVALQPLIAASHIYDWLITLPITLFFSHWEGKQHLPKFLIDLFTKHRTG